MAQEDMMDKLKDLLSDPDAMGTISKMFNQSNTSDSFDSATSSSADNMMKIKSIADAVSTNDDPKINLLHALKPYMNTTRSAHVDKAIKMIQMTKITSVLKNLDL